MSGCEWPIDETCLPELPGKTDPGYAAAVSARDAAQALASSVLWGLSGRQFGVCPVMARPCSHTMPPGRYPGAGLVTSYVLSWEGDGWLNWPCGCPGPLCRETGPAAVHLPGPARDVIEVRVNGTPLDADSYRLEADVLYRVGAIWPVQDLSRPAGQPNTWTVEYLRGYPVPPGVDRLTGLLAKEFMSACSGEKCRLPRNVTQVSRQGISYSVFNPNQMYESGKTGLAEIDLWLAAVNPRKLQNAPSVR